MLAETRPSRPKRKRPFPISLPRKGEKALDLWTLVHVASGMALSVAGVPWTWAAGILIAYEGLEGLLRRIKLEEGGLFEHESWPNVVADVVLGLAGFFLVRFVAPNLRIFNL